MSTDMFEIEVPEAFGEIEIARNVEVGDIIPEDPKRRLECHEEQEEAADEIDIGWTEEGDFSHESQDSSSIEGREEWEYTSDGADISWTVAEDMTSKSHEIKLECHDEGEETTGQIDFPLSPESESADINPSCQERKSECREETIGEIDMACSAEADVNPASHEIKSTFREEPDEIAAQSDAPLSPEAESADSSPDSLERRSDCEEELDESTFDNDIPSSAETGMKLNPEGQERKLESQEKREEKTDEIGIPLIVDAGISPDSQEGVTSTECPKERGETSGEIAIPWSAEVELNPEDQEKTSELSREESGEAIAEIDMLSSREMAMSCKSQEENHSSLECREERHETSAEIDMSLERILSGSRKESVHTITEKENLNDLSNYIEKVAVTSSPHASVHSSPRSTLAWKDHWGYESASPEPCLNPLQESPYSVAQAPPQAPQQSPCRSLSNPVPSVTTSPGKYAPIHHWRSLPQSPIRRFQLDGDEEAAHGPRTPDRCETTSRDRTFSWTSSIECPLVQEDEVLHQAASDDSERGDKLEQNREHFITALNEELNLLKSCAKRAIDLGKQVERYAAAEMLQLRTQKMNAEGRALQTAEWNRALEQQLSILREEKQILERETQAQLLAMRNENEKLENERGYLLVNFREEKKKRERVQREKDCVLSVLLDDRMKSTTQREAMEGTVRSMKKKLEDMERERDAAVKALANERQNMDIERDAMLMSMRELRTRLEFERDLKLSSMRRSNLDICIANMSSGDRRKSFRSRERSPLPSWKQ